MISANLAQNRVRLIHEVDLYTEIYGTMDGSNFVDTMITSTTMDGSNFVDTMITSTTMDGSNFVDTMIT